MKVMSKRKKTSDGQPLPRTAQQVVPYLRVYPNGIIETDNNVFSKAYSFPNMNFTTISLLEQNRVFQSWVQFLSSLSEDKHCQLIINNVNADEEEILHNVLIPLEKDELNPYRTEMNEILRDKFHEGRNNIKSEKYFVISQFCEGGVKEAITAFSRFDGEFLQRMREVTGIADLNIKALTSEERIIQLHHILNVGKENELQQINLEQLASSGCTTKEIVSPDGYAFNEDFFRMGNKYARVLYGKAFPATLTTDFIADISAMPFNFTFSVSFDTLSTMDAVNKVKNLSTNIRSNVIEAEKRAFKNGYSGELINPELKYSQEQAEGMLETMRSGEQRLYSVNITLMHYGDTKQELDGETQMITNTGNKHMVTFGRLLTQQEIGFRNTLPLARKDLKIRRLMPTDSLGLFLPFTTREMMEKGGIYYGLNAVSNNMLVYNRLNAMNQNGLILGMPGSGKSFSAKREMLSVLLNTKDDVYIIDPEREYAAMAKAFGGNVIKLKPGSGNYLNPFDMDIHYGDGDDGEDTNPIAMKADFICSMCETAIGKHYELNSIEKSIIGRVVNQLYKPYMNHMLNDLKDMDITCDKQASPTMDNFYELLMRQPEPEAHNIALALEIYCTGQLDSFAHKTNMETNSRLVVYDIKEIGSGMKELGLMVCLNEIWNKIISNQRVHKRTWFYIDEFHILLKTASSTEFVEQIWRRARKWGGIPTAITQNINQLLTSEEALTIVENTDFVLILAQSPPDRMTLQDMYKLSDTQCSYITNSPPGQGLLRTGETVIPFVDKFPTNTKLYHLMSSKADERQSS
jgi:hypothetical protein